MLLDEKLSWRARRLLSRVPRRQRHLGHLGDHGPRPWRFPYLAAAGERVRGIRSRGKAGGVGGGSWNRNQPAGLDKRRHGAYCEWVANVHSIAAHWTGGFEEAGLQRWAEQLRGQLQPAELSLGLVFMAPRFFPHARQVLEILQVHARIPLLMGCSSQGLIAGA